MEIVLTIINTIFFVSTWYFLGRSSIYNKLLKDYRDILRIAIEQERLLGIYKAAEETEEENGKQN
jgi:hypothetical protein